MTDVVQLLELPEHDMVCVTIDVGEDELLALGERINAQWDMAYMNGYNWEALIHAFVKPKDPDREALVEPDPEADTYSGGMAYNADNIEKMRRFQGLIRDLLADESALFQFIEANDIPWD